MSPGKALSSVTGKRNPSLLVFVTQEQDLFYVWHRDGADAAPDWSYSFRTQHKAEVQMYRAAGYTLREAKERMRAHSRLKVLSVRQPWASLIASGEKSLEVRCWSTDYRGPLLIVSGGRPWKDSEGNVAPFASGPLGVAICIVDVVGCRPAVAADVAGALVAPGPGDFVWELANPRPVPHVPHRGKLGLYEAPPSLIAEVLPSAA